MNLRMKSCPFCGGEAYLADTWDGRIAVKCTLCGCGTVHYKQKESAIHQWNQRIQTETDKRQKKNDKTAL